MRIFFVNNRTGMINQFAKYTGMLINGGTFTGDGKEYRIIDISVDLINNLIRIYFDNMK